MQCFSPSTPLLMFHFAFLPQDSVLTCLKWANPHCEIHALFIGCQTSLRVLNPYMEYWHYYTAPEHTLWCWYRIKEHRWAHCVYIFITNIKYFLLQEDMNVWTSQESWITSRKHSLDRSGYLIIFLFRTPFAGRKKTVLETLFI